MKKRDKNERETKEKERQRTDQGNMEVTRVNYIIAKGGKQRQKGFMRSKHGCIARGEKYPFLRGGGGGLRRKSSSSDQNIDP
jgi:hypothetical protein